MATAVARPKMVTSAAGVLSLLEEQENALRVYALQRLNEVVDQFWPEIADYLTDIESLYEDASFSDKELAALVASKVFYHLEEYDDALRLALGAGKLFDISIKSEYVETMIRKAIDEYIRLKNENFEAELKGKEQVDIDPRLEDVVARMFDRCKSDKAFKQGLGIALETRRLDKVREFIVDSGESAMMLEYCYKVAVTMVQSRAFRTKLMHVLIGIYKDTGDTDKAALCQCYYFLRDHQAVVQILSELNGASDSSSRLMAYQIAFDLVENEDQHFCNMLLSSPLLKLKEPKAPQPAAAPAPEAEAAAAGDGSAAPAAGEEGAAMEVEAAKPVEEEPLPTDGLTEEQRESIKMLRHILCGRASIDLYLEFLYRNNHSDLLLLENIKNSIDQRNSITHNGTVIAHGLMQCGTTSDVFLRNNLEWLGKASNWAKFAATASLGVIHKGHIKESRSILSTYLPQPGGQSGSPYSEGGALYAMGLIHANHFDFQTNAYLLEQLHAAQASDVLQHGACLGIGLTCMATANESIYEELKQTLYTDKAVGGEAAAYAIGLVMMGSASDKAIGELLAYAHDTQHEKIIRACAVALAMMMYRREEEADTLIQQLLLDKDAILRYGACFMIALAYTGTSNNASIRKLLHISVSDVSDDVRRAAVMALGFVMCNVPDQIPSVVKLLSESYNPHVRYAAALALGIACNGTANVDAHNLLHPLTSDAVDFVRQGAIIALGLLYMQASPARVERVKEFRTQLTKIIGDKHEDAITRFGAIIANGILDAGGRNSCASFFSKSGSLRGGAAIGFTLFTQMWYWFPMIHMLSLSFTPTALIGLNDKLKMPKNFSFKSGCKPSLFAYPEPLTPPKKEENVKSAAAVLSTAAKAKAQKDKDEKDASTGIKKKDLDEQMGDNASVCDSAAGAGSIAATQGTTVVGSPSEIASDSFIEGDKTAMDVDSKPSDATTAKADGKGGEKKDGDAMDVDATAKEEPEKTSEILNNPSRVVAPQMEYISFLTQDDAENPQRYIAILKNRKSGFLMLSDQKPEEPEDVFVEEDKPKEEEEKEAEPPEPFEWTAPAEPAAAAAPAAQEGAAAPPGN